MLSEQAMERIAEMRFRLGTASEKWQSHLTDCLQELPIEQRDLIARHYAGEESIKTIAEELQAAPSALYMRLSRVRRLLLECLERSAGMRAKP